MFGRLTGRGGQWFVDSANVRSLPATSARPDLAMFVKKP
jgi:hypothetical protein